jgi:hypothetical protein
MIGSLAFDGAAGNAVIAARSSGKPHGRYVIWDARR